MMASSDPVIERLGSFKFGSALATSGNILIPPRDMLLIMYRVTGYSNTDIAAFQFNSDTTATNYTSSHVNVTTTPTMARVNNVGSLAHIPVASTAMTVGRVGYFQITNFATARKVIKIFTADEQTVTTAATIDISGYGEWLNTAAQITSIAMLASAGRNLNIGTGFTVFGWNI